MKKHPKTYCLLPLLGTITVILFAMVLNQFGIIFYFSTINLNQSIVPLILGLWLSNLLGRHYTQDNKEGRKYVNYATLAIISFFVIIFLIEILAIPLLYL